jgi:hypothetical protein
MSHPVFRPGLSLGQTYRPVHLLLVVIQHRNGVPEHQEFGCLQLSLGGALERALCFEKTVR